MSKSIPSADRLLNKYLPSSTDKDLLNADNVNLICDAIVNGAYNQKLMGGAEADKPVSPEEREIYVVTETNYKAIEMYFTTFGWLILKGIWTDAANRPPSAGLAPFSEGFNIDEDIREVWNGTTWRNF